MKECNKCIYYTKIDDYKGKCRVNPPINSNQKFPVIETAEWCGKYDDGVDEGKMISTMQCQKKVDAAWLKGCDDMQSTIIEAIKTGTKDKIRVAGHHMVELVESVEIPKK